MVSVSLAFLSTPSARRATRHRSELCFIFSLFLSTPSARRATNAVDKSRHLSGDFYPRPPRGGRLPPCASSVPHQQFLSTPSARRATCERSSCDQLLNDFYPRPPRGGRPLCYPTAVCDGHFYPRPPRGGRPPSSGRAHRGPRFLSTPSARRATLHSSRLGHLLFAFLSTPSARRATAGPLPQGSQLF